jgi:CheY-like chemotaxis protein
MLNPARGSELSYEDREKHQLQRNRLRRGYSLSDQIAVGYHNLSLLTCLVCDRLIIGHFHRLVRHHGARTSYGLQPTFSKESIMWMDVISEQENLPQTQTISPRPGCPLRVLVVDDENLMLQLMNRMLQTLGFEAVLADGGLEAIECLKRSRYDLVITDLQMPGLNGHALAEWIKHRFHDIPVIMMTGNPPSAVTEYMQTGSADHWIFKPFSLSELETTLRDFD